MKVIRQGALVVHEPSQAHPPGLTFIVGWRFENDTAADGRQALRACLLHIARQHGITLDSPPQDAAPTLDSERHMLRVITAARHGTPPRSDAMVNDWLEPELLQPARSPRRRPPVAAVIFGAVIGAIVAAALTHAWHRWVL